MSVPRMDVSDSSCNRAQQHTVQQGQRVTPIRARPDIQANYSACDVCISKLFIVSFESNNGTQKNNTFYEYYILSK